MGQEERSFMTTIEIKVMGHIIGEDKNQEKPKMVIRETAAEIKIQRERAVFEDELDFHLENKNKIRS
jgi:hypothetical protein